MIHVIPNMDPDSPTLVLGAGFSPECRNPNTINTDRYPSNGQRRLELLEIPWTLDHEPIEDESFDVVVAHNVFEHLPHIELDNGQDAFVAVMNEAWRVLRIGGVLDIELPNASSLLAITHPGHRRLFAPQSFSFFLTPKHDEDWMASPPGAWNGYPLEYPIKLWDRLHFEMSEGNNLFLIMLQKPDPDTVDWSKTPEAQFGHGSQIGGRDE
jgi:SAM-dependent methyltransferase